MLFRPVLIYRSTRNRARRVELFAGPEKQEAGIAIPKKLSFPNFCLMIRKFVRSKSILDHHKLTLFDAITTALLRLSAESAKFLVLTSDQSLAISTKLVSIALDSSLCRTKINLTT